MPGLANGGTAFYLICAIFGVVLLGMAANEWRRLGTGDYKRRTVAAAGLLLGCGLGLLVVQFGWGAAIRCLPWLLAGLSLTLFAWAFLFEAFGSARRAAIFVAVFSVLLAALAAFCLLRSGQRPLLGLVEAPWLAVLLLLNGIALFLWLRHRRQFSPWLGIAFLLPMLGVIVGLLAPGEVALLGFLAGLPLLAVETYRGVLSDLSAYGDELQTVSEHALQQTQDLAFLLEVGQAVTASLDLPVVLERVSEAVARAVDADWAYVLLPAEDDPETLTVAARYGWWGRRWEQDSQPGRQIFVHLDELSLLRHAIYRRRQVIASRPEDYEQFEPLHKMMSRPQTGPTLIQPIYSQDRSLGVVLLGHVGNQRDFSETDSRLCQALAAQVATAIDNARLYQSVDEQARRLAALLRVREEEVTQRQAILESIADGVVVAGEAEDVVLANAAAERILGVPREKLIGKTIKRLYAELLRTGGRKRGDRAVFTWGDKEVTGSMAPVKMPDDTLLGYVAVFRDVTREQQSERSKAKFIETVSHELRTPLTSIKGYIELMAAGAVGDIAPQQRHFLEIVGANTERMVSLVNNLITVSEMEQGTVATEPRPVDIKSLIEEAVQAQMTQMEAKGMHLVVDVTADLPPAWGDPQQLRQIMDNLLDNALRYTPSEGRISVWVAEANLKDLGGNQQHYLVISVRDTGVGIPPQEHKRIFEKFYRVDNPLSVEAGGTGMGLAIVHSLVEAHGGRIWVDSEPGAGSTFSFTVPTTRN